MAKLFEGLTANDVWEQARIELTGTPKVQRQAGRGGLTYELLHVVFSIADPRQRWIISRKPAINPAFAIAEIVWILNGRNDSAFVNSWNGQLPQFAGSGECYHGAYGFRLRKHFGIDQLERAYSALSANPDSRQIVLQIWDPIADLPDSKGKPANTDVPCNIASLLKIRNGKLDWSQIVRSNDLFRGVPYNFVQFSTLQEVLAGWLGVEVGCYTQLSDSLHLYERDFAALTSYSRDLQPNLDTLCLPKAEADTAWRELSSRMDTMRRIDLTREELLELLSSALLKTPFKNLLCIVAAETARRSGWFDSIDSFTLQCTNPVLIQLWENWFERVGQQRTKVL